MPPPILISACLAGHCTNWRGRADLAPWAREMLATGEAIAVCPEQLGGLPTPRVPMERRGDRVVSATGADCTEAMRRGAERTVEIARQHGCQVAVLKSRSPSCGLGLIYDGTFSGTMTDGDGVTAEGLRSAGLRVVSDEEIADIEALRALADS